MILEYNIVDDNAYTVISSLKIQFCGSFSDIWRTVYCIYHIMNTTHIHLSHITG